MRLDNWDDSKEVANVAGYLCDQCYLDRYWVFGEAMKSLFYPYQMVGVSNLQYIE